MLVRQEGNAVNKRPDPSLALVRAAALALLLASPLASGPARAQAPAPALAWGQLPSLPDPIGFAGPFAGTSGGALVVAGGANFAGKDNFAGAPKVWYDRIFVLDRPDGQWREAAERLPKPLGYGIAVTWRDQVVCVGGESTGGAMQDDAFALAWDGTKATVRPLPRLPLAAGYLSGALVGDTLYAVGGNGGALGALNQVWSLDLSKPDAERAWKAEPPLPGPPLLLTVTGSADGKLFVFGGGELTPNWRGVTDRVFHRETWILTPGKGWARGRDMPSTLAAGPTPAPLVGGELLVLGGDDGGLFYRSPEVGHRHPGFPATAYAYDPAKDTWRVAGSLPVQPGPSLATQPREAVMPPVTTVTTTWNGAVVVPSGEIRPGTRTPRVLRMEPPTR